MDWQLAIILAATFGCIAFAVWDLVIYMFLEDDDE